MFLIKTVIPRDINLAWLKVRYQFYSKVWGKIEILLICVLWLYVNTKANFCKIKRCADWQTQVSLKHSTLALGGDRPCAVTMVPEPCKPFKVTWHVPLGAISSNQLKVVSILQSSGLKVLKWAKPKSKTTAIFKDFLKGNPCTAEHVRIHRWFTQMLPAAPKKPHLFLYTPFEESVQKGKKELTSYGLPTELLYLTTYMVEFKEAGI